jgi:hypothetical protein
MTPATDEAGPSKELSMWIAIRWLEGDGPDDADIAGPFASEPEADAQVEAWIAEEGDTYDPEMHMSEVRKL